LKIIETVYGEVLVGGQRVYRGDKGEGNMMDGLPIHILSRTMKPLAIVLSGAGRGLWE
jgi:hypothetical protein